LRTRDVDEGIGDLDTRNPSDDGVDSPQRARLVLADSRGHNAEVHERIRGEEVNVMMLEFRGCLYLRASSNCLLLDNGERRHLPLRYGSAGTSLRLSNKVGFVVEEATMGDRRGDEATRLRGRSGERTLMSEMSGR
jgi:hypothetical protein